MSSQRRFEGTDLEALLEEVRNELGDDVHIVAANRVRKGGVGGFFAREYFEVVAEEPEMVTADKRPAARLGRRRRDVEAEPVAASRSVPRSVLDLVEERNEEERVARAIDLEEIDAREAFAGDGPTWSSSAADQPQYVPDTMPPAHAAADAFGEAVIDVHLDPPRVSTETERFAQILERLAHTTEHRTLSSSHAAARTPAPAPTPAPVPVAFAERAEPERRLAAPPASMPPAAVAATPTAVATMPAPARAYDTNAPLATAAPAAAPAAAPVAAPEAPTLPPMAAAARTEVVSLVDAERAQQAPRPVVHTAPLVATPDERAEETIERPEQMLVRLGLPARCVPRGVTGAALRAALVESLERLPQAAALPRTKGVVVAIVGIGARPVLLGRSLCQELGLDPEDVVVATQTEIDGVPAWLQITEPEAADERRRSWRRRDHITFVAVSQPALTSGAAWASNMLDQLEPTQVWGLASAGWKPEDVDAWSRRLGGFDLVALDRLVDTVSPASMLTLGIPIGRLDGDAATPQRWADVLLDRVLVPATANAGGDGSRA